MRNLLVKEGVAVIEEDGFKRNCKNDYD